MDSDAFGNAEDSAFSAGLDRGRLVQSEKDHYQHLNVVPTRLQQRGDDLREAGHKHDDYEIAFHDDDGTGRDVASELLVGNEGDANKEDGALNRLAVQQLLERTDCCRTKCYLEFHSQIEQENLLSLALSARSIQEPHVRKTLILGCLCGSFVHADSEALRKRKRLKMGGADGEGAGNLTIRSERRNSVSYHVFGKVVCRSFFMRIFGCSPRLVTQLIARFSVPGVELKAVLQRDSRRGNNRGRHVDDIVLFLVSYMRELGFSAESDSVFGGDKKPDTVMIPRSLDKKSLYEDYKEGQIAARKAFCSYSFFLRVWKSRIPQLKSSWEVVALISKGGSPSIGAHKMSGLAVKRLGKELKKLLEGRPNPLFQVQQPSNLFEWVVFIHGADGTIYTGETYKLRFRFSETYPIESPEVVFIGGSPANEHIYSNGHICLSILDSGPGGGWSPAMTVEAVCISIISALASAKAKMRPPDDRSYSSRWKGSPKSTRWLFHDDNV